MSDYGFVHDGRVYTPNGSDVPAGDNDARNRAIETEELARWQARPDRFVAYYHTPNVRRGTEHYRGRTIHNSPLSIDREGAHVSTWLGTRLGTITSARVYRHNFGGRFVSLRVQGSNGAEYHGRASWDWGDVIVLRKVKGRHEQHRDYGRETGGTR